MAREQQDPQKSTQKPGGGWQENPDKKSDTGKTNVESTNPGKERSSNVPSERSGDQRSGSEGFRSNTDRSRESGRMKNEAEEDEIM